LGVQRRRTVADWIHSSQRKSKGSSRAEKEKVRANQGPPHWRAEEKDKTPWGSKAVDSQVEILVKILDRVGGEDLKNGTQLEERRCRRKIIEVP